MAHGLDLIGEPSGINTSNNDSNKNDDDNSNNNNDIVAYKYWVGVHRGIIVSHYDMIPHSSILESLGLVQVSENIVEFIKKSMKNWNSNLTSCGEYLANVDIRRGIFQGDSFSPLIFVICMIPLT